MFLGTCTGISSSMANSMKFSAIFLIPGAELIPRASRRMGVEEHILSLSPTIDLFYRYGGHIELIRFKEYYRMPRGHEHISFVFSSAVRDIFLKVFLE